MLCQFRPILWYTFERLFALERRDRVESTSFHWWFYTTQVFYECLYQSWTLSNELCSLFQRMDCFQIERVWQKKCLNMHKNNWALIWSSSNAFMRSCRCLRSLHLFAENMWNLGISFLSGWSFALVLDILRTAGIKKQWLSQIVNWPHHEQNSNALCQKAKCSPVV